MAVVAAAAETLGAVVAGRVAEHPTAGLVGMLAALLVGSTLLDAAGRTAFSGVVARAEGRLRADLLHAALHQPLPVLEEQAVGRATRCCGRFWPGWSPGSRGGRPGSHSRWSRCWRRCWCARSPGWAEWSDQAASSASLRSAMTRLREQRVRMLLEGAPALLVQLGVVAAWTVHLTGFWDLATALLASTVVSGAGWFGIVFGFAVTEAPVARRWLQAVSDLAGGVDVTRVPPGVDLPAGTAPAPPAAGRVPLKRLTLDRVTAVHDDGTVDVQEVDLTIDAGSLVLLTGRVGSGKSSLLGSLAGLVDHEGSIRWNDLEVDGSWRNAGATWRARAWSETLIESAAGAAHRAGSIGSRLSARSQRLGERVSLGLESATTHTPTGSDTGSDAGGDTTRSVVRRRLWVLATGSTTPDRLRRLGAVLVVGCLLAGVVGLIDGAARAEAVSEGGTRIAAVHDDAAEVYRSLADADAMATSGFVSGGQEPAEVRARYDRDIADASARLVHAAGMLPADDPAAPAVATISAQLPLYNGLVESARTYNRLGLPIGQSYLDSASRLMARTILPAADELRRQQAAALADNYDRAGAAPIAVLLIGLAALAAVIDAAVRERRRTQRVLSVGLTVAAAALMVALLWWVIAILVAGGRLAEAGQHSAVADTLDEARAAVLQARSNESLVLVARGGGAADTGFTAAIDRVLGTPDERGLLAAATDAAEPASDGRIADVRAATEQWNDAHRRLRELDDGGNYRDAVSSATGADPEGSGVAFDRLGAVLGQTIDAERASFRADADAATAALTGLAIGPGVLALLAAGAAAVGIGRRVEEYR